MRYRPIRRNSEFGRVYARGKSYVNPALVMYVLKTRGKKTRVGLTATKKIGHAVQRNRLRRQLREIYRLHETSFARGYDLVVVARSRAIGADYAALERAYLSLAAKLGLLGGQTA